MGIAMTGKWKIIIKRIKESKEKFPEDPRKVVTNGADVTNSPPVAMRLHRVRNFDEARNVRTGEQAW